MKKDLVMNTIVRKRSPDMAYPAFLFIFPVIFYWGFWAICLLVNDSSIESEIMLRTIIPRKIVGLPIHLVIFLLTAVSLYFAISAKLRKRTRWYKTPLHIRFAMGLGMFLMFLIFLQALM